MTIKKGAVIGKRNGLKEDGSQDYTWDKYPIFLQKVGHHSTTVEQMLEAGWMLRVPTDYNSATHKLVPGSFSDDGINICQNTVELSIEELVTTLSEMINSKYIEITEAYKSADNSLFAGYTDQQQKTFYKQEEEAKNWLVNNNYLTPFIDGRVSTSAGVKTKQQIVDLIINISSSITTTAGANFERYQILLEDLVNIEHTADYLTEKAKLDLIIW